MKKYLIALFFGLTTFFITACGDDEVKARADSFMQNIISSNYDAAFDLTTDSLKENKAERSLAKGIFVAKFAIINNLVDKPDNMKIVAVNDLEGNKNIKLVVFEITQKEGETAKTENTILQLEKVNNNWYVKNIK